MKNSHQDDKSDHNHFIHKLDKSALLTIIGVILLFSTAVIVTLIAPRYVDPTWTSPSSSYQVQMYEIEDPNLYISSVATKGKELQYVHHLKENFTLLAFKEFENLRIVAPSELEKFVTKIGDENLKLTSKLLMLREPKEEMATAATILREKLQKEDEAKVKEPGHKEKYPEKIRYQVMELYNPQIAEAFSFDLSGGIIQDWVDQKFNIIDEKAMQPFHKESGVTYVQNPIEFRFSLAKSGDDDFWRYDPDGKTVSNLIELTSPSMGFHSRKDMIAYGEHIYAIEGCWYCHTDQTRTLIEDVVLNGSDSYPSPPSSPNEYIYQKITFAGTRRIGPDISRVGVKRPSRDWHKSHFWSPKTASIGSIMPSFRHFFDNDPRGTSKGEMGIPNYQFEAIYQYMMTKGTRITAPTQAWWLGKDPIKTKEIIEGQRTSQ